VIDAPPLPPAPVPEPALPRRSFWQRRITDPVLALLTQGVTPDRVAFTLALGTGLSLFPFFGFTTLLNLGVGIWLRLNQPILHTLNQVLGPVHLVMIVVYVRIGEAIWSAERIPLSVSVLLQTFREETFVGFLQRFGWAGVHAFTAWLITLPLLVFGLQAIVRPIIRHAAQRVTRTPQVSPP